MFDDAHKQNIHHTIFTKKAKTKKQDKEECKAV